MTYGLDTWAARIEARKHTEDCDDTKNKTKHCDVNALHHLPQY
jgi:hypothetical protein